MLTLAESDLLVSWLITSISVIKLAQLMSPKSRIKPSFPEFLA